MVRSKTVDMEVLRHKGGFVILEQAPIGVCEKCGSRYFDAAVVRRAAEIGRGASPAERTLTIPVGRF